MEVSKKPLKGKRSIEVLSHFSCPHCHKWFSISEAPIDETRWDCPWCYMISEYVVEEQPNES